jgi:hypothetical protein
MHANLSLSVWSVDLSGVAMEAGVALHCPCIIRHYGKNCVRPGREKGEEGRTLILGRVAVKKLNTHNRCRRLDRRDRCKLIRQSERVLEGQRFDGLKLRCFRRITSGRVLPTRSELIFTDVGRLICSRMNI